MENLLFPFRLFQRNKLRNWKFLEKELGKNLNSMAWASPIKPGSNPCPFSGNTILRAITGPIFNSCENGKGFPQLKIAQCCSNMQAYSTQHGTEKGSCGENPRILFGKPYAVQIFLSILFQGISNSFVYFFEINGTEKEGFPSCFQRKHDHFKSSKGSGDPPNF